MKTIASRDKPVLDVAPRPQLLTYPDSLGGDLRSLAEIIDGPLGGLFRGVHILPPFPSSGDRGFAPVTYSQIDPRFGSWEDIRRIGARYDVLLDVMINHMSRRSAEFRDFEAVGRRSPYADLFVTLEKIWPNGDPPASDVARIFLRKPGAPFSTITIEETGERERVWTSFGTADWSEQIDLDVTSPVTRRLIGEWLELLAGQGVRIVRLDAVGYVTKKAGTSCFMVEPEIWEFLAWVTGIAGSLGLVVLPEVHEAYATHARITSHGLWTYDFVLPGLVLHALRTGEGSRLARHLATSPARQFTILDCHDGIPVRPDLDGILEPDEMLALADSVEAHGGNVNRLLSASASATVDVHQLNCTYYSALGCDDDRYVSARAIQLFARGVPQVYYVGLLAGANDEAAVARTGDGRAINRHDYTREELEAELTRPVVRRIVDLVRLRNTHPAFEGDLAVELDSSSLLMRWQNGPDVAELRADLATGVSTISTNRTTVRLARGVC
ncbi:MAG TPA: sucrose phosphorylase [Candidatus Limnocylindrales bacterium]|nr:sucrose phosphorylase [Candidatus Limnocylindrales bacterium]